MWERRKLADRTLSAWRFDGSSRSHFMMALVFQVFVLLWLAGVATRGWAWLNFGVAVLQQAAVIVSLAALPKLSFGPAGIASFDAWVPWERVARFQLSKRGLLDLFLLPDPETDEPVIGAPPRWVRLRLLAPPGRGRAISEMMYTNVGRYGGRDTYDPAMAALALQRAPEDVTVRSLRGSRWLYLVAFVAVVVTVPAAVAVLDAIGAPDWASVAVPLVPVAALFGMVILLIRWVRFDANGVTTRSWSLAWDDVRRFDLDERGLLVLVVARAGGIEERVDLNLGRRPIQQQRVDALVRGYLGMRTLAGPA